MGRSDPHYFNFCKQFIKPEGKIALLGVNNNYYLHNNLGYSSGKGDLYDLSLGNWDINSQWSFSKKYDTIICTRCAYFAKDPGDFIIRCYNNLSSQGKLFVDWGIGDHWRFSNYKVGWIKNKEHEWAYRKGNYLWSGIWDDSFTEKKEFKLFSQRIKKFNYPNTYSAILEEIPRLLDISFIDKYFEVTYDMLALWEDFPQLYILLNCKKRN